MGSNKALQARQGQRFAKKLREAREASGLSQEAVARAMGRGQRFVSRCEQADRRVDAVEFRDFCRVFKLPPGFFIEGLPES